MSVVLRRPEVDSADLHRPAQRLTLEPWPSRHRPQPAQQPLQVLRRHRPVAREHHGQGERQLALGHRPRQVAARRPPEGTSCEGHPPPPPPRPHRVRGHAPDLPDPRQPWRCRPVHQRCHQNDDWRHVPAPAEVQRGRRCPTPAARRAAKALARSVLPPHRPRSARYPRVLRAVENAPTPAASSLRFLLRKEPVHLPQNRGQAGARHQLLVHPSSLALEQPGRKPPRLLIVKLAEGVRLSGAHDPCGTGCPIRHRP